MPKMIVVDGCEKSGKSYLLDEIERQALDQGYFLMKYHWDRPQNKHWNHKKTLQDQFDSARIEEQLTGKTGLILWNRSQASESIYSKLLKRGSPIGTDPLLGEFQYGRAESTLGPRLILLGPNLETLIALRDETDLPVDPAEEREEYKRYGLEYGFRVYENKHDPMWAREMAANLLQELAGWYNFETLGGYTGPQHPKYIIFAGGTVNNWIPISSVLQTEPWSHWGGKVLNYGFATIDAPKEILKRAEYLVIPRAQGRYLKTYARYYLGYPESKILTITQFQRTVLGEPNKIGA